MYTQGLITPNNVRYRKWRVFVLILVVWELFYAPWNWGFEPKQTEPGLSPWIQVAEHIIDFVFMFDFGLRFFVAKKDSRTGILITSRKRLWKSYMKKHFIIDFVTCVPLDKVVAYSMGYGGFSVEDQVDMNSLPIVKWFVRFRILRGYRVYEIIKIIDDLDHTRTTWFFYSSASHYMRFVLLVLSIFVLAHVFSALWYSAGYMGQENGWNWQQQRELCGVKYEDQEYAKDILLDPSTSVEFYNYTSQIFPGFSEDELWTPKDCIDSGEFDGVGINYSVSLLASIFLLLTGENLEPILENEKLTQIMYLIFGIFITAMVYGNVHSLVHNIMARTSAYRRKMEVVYDEMDRLKLPKGLQQRIFYYYEYVFKEHGTLDGSLIGFVPEISVKLQAEIYLWQRFNLVHSVPFFQKISPVVLQEMVMKMSVEIFLPGDYVVTMGDYGDCMYFIYTGQCEVLVPLTEPELEAKRQSIIEEEEQKRNGRRRSSIGNSAAQFGDMIRRGSRAGGHNPRNSMKNADGTDMKIVEEMKDERSGGVVRSVTKALGKGAIKGEAVKKPVKTRTYKVVATLNAGQYFGEVAVVLHSKRTASIRSKACCEVCVLTNEIYNSVAEQYPKDAHYMKSIILSKYSKVINEKKPDEATSEEGKKKDEGKDDQENADERSSSITSTVPSTPSRGNSNLSMQGANSPLTQLKGTADRFNADMDGVGQAIEKIYHEELRTSETISSIQRRLLKIATGLEDGI